MAKYIVYSDGACSNNHDSELRVGAYAASIFAQVKGQTFKKDIEGAEEGATNNQMELRPIIEALKAIVDIDPSDTPEVVVYSDSQYAILGATKWLSGWKANGWKTKDGAVKNREMWILLDALMEKTKCTFEKVKGDNSVKWNKYCDERARKLCGSKPKRVSA